MKQADAVDLGKQDLVRTQEDAVVFFPKACSAIAIVILRCARRISTEVVLTRVVCLCRIARTTL